MSNQLMGNMLTEHVMEKAIKDKLVVQQQQQQEQEYKKYLEQQKKQNEEQFDPDFDDDDLKELMVKLKEQRIKEMENRFVSKQQQPGVGEYREIVEEEFLPSVTKNKFSIVHFYHEEFLRCKIMDDHLRKIAQTHPECKFFYLNSEKAPFFVQKLSIKVLPTLCLFFDGILKDRVVGFEDLGSKDNFETIALIRRLVKAKIIQPKNRAEKGFRLKYGEESEHSDDDYDEEQQ